MARGAVSSRCRLIWLLSRLVSSRRLTRAPGWQPLARQRVHLSKHTWMALPAEKKTCQVAHADPVNALSPVRQYGYAMAMVLDPASIASIDFLSGHCCGAPTSRLPDTPQDKGREVATSA